MRNGTLSEHQNHLGGCVAGRVYIAQVPTLSSGILIHLVGTGARHGAHAQPWLKTMMIRE